MNFSTNFPAPTIASRDYRVRLSPRQFDTLVFEHLFTQQDPAVLSHAAGAPRAGMTEWVGRCAAGVVSLCWDWAQGADGNLYLLKEVAPRTNLMVIDATGYDRPGDLALPDLWTLIEGIPWPAAVAEAVASIPPFPPSARTNH